MDTVRVQKLNAAGAVTWEYDGRIIHRKPDTVVLEAFFDRDDLQFQDVVFRRHDRFVETFYSDRWYNIFEVHDREDDRLKGWYCNIGRPATLGRTIISYVDLALDLWVTPAGQQTVLDLDEFENLELDPTEHSRAWAALGELQALFNEKTPPL